MWNDGIVEALDIESGKALYSIDTSKKSTRQAEITCFSWSSHGTSGRVLTPGNVRKDSSEDRTDSMLQNIWRTDAFPPKPETNVHSRIPDFPEQLALLDLTDQLPKLSPLVHVEDSKIPDLPSADKFLTQASTDISLLVNSGGDRQITDADVKLISHRDGRVCTYLYDDFDAGDYHLFATVMQDAQITRHSSHIDSDCHSLLIRNTANGELSNETAAVEGGLSLTLLQLNAVGQSSIFSEYVVQLTTRMTALVQYLLLSAASMRLAWSASQDLPKRFMSNVNESLAEEKQPSNLIQSFYHTCLTGDCPPVVQDWLKDQIGERGHKRWDQAVTTGYSKVLDIAHNHFLPALDHAGLTASRLRSLSRTPDIPIFEVSEKPLTDILSLLDICRILAHTILSITAEESRMFRVFSSWLQLLIQYTGAEPDSATAQETADKMAETDYPKLLAYITGAMSQSRLSPFLETSTEVIVGNLREDLFLPTRVEVVGLLDQVEEGAPLPQSPKTDMLDALHNILRVRSTWTTLFESIPNGLRAQTHIQNDVALEQSTMTDLLDIRTVIEVP